MTAKQKKGGVVENATDEVNLSERERGMQWENKRPRVKQRFLCRYSLQIYSTGLGVGRGPTPLPSRHRIILFPIFLFTPSISHHIFFYVLLYPYYYLLFHIPSLLTLLCNSTQPDDVVHFKSNNWLQGLTIEEGLVQLVYVEI